MSDYLYDGEGEDPEVSQLEELLGDYKHRAPLKTLPPRANRSRTVVIAAVVAIAAVLVIALMLPDSSQPEPIAEAPQPTQQARCEAGQAGFRFAIQSGTANCDGDPTQSGVLPVGAWLETTAEASAKVEVADIGALTIHGDSRLRLVGTGPDEHRLELARGRVSAEVVAPPRLFVVDTPAAAAVDLGCAYELAVDDDERTHLRVTLGSVSLEGPKHGSWVPAGYEAYSRPGVGPTLPLAFEASTSLRDAAARFDGGDASALGGLLAAADKDDAVTLWNLLDRTTQEERSSVFERLQSFNPPPDGVERAHILAGDRVALDAWRDSIESSWFE
jgi:hypothetical protein